MPTRPAAKFHVVTASDHAKPDLRIAFEPFYVIARELPPLLRKHWRELAVYRDVIPLDFNWDQYMAYTMQGVLHVLTVRNATDELVGYIFALFGPHMHSKATPMAVVDMYWLDPRYRRGWFPVTMFTALEKQMRKLGAVRLDIGERLHFKNTRGRKTRTIFQRLGYKAVDVVFSKKLVED